MSEDPLRGDRAAARSRGHYPLSLSHLDVETLSFESLTVYDSYLEREVHGRQALALVVDRLMDHLPGDQRDCLHLVVVSGMSMAEAARTLDWWLPSGDEDRKKVLRHTQRGLEQMRDWLLGTPWMGFLLDGRIPDGVR